MTSKFARAEPLVITKHADGSITVKDFPARILIYDAFLQSKELHPGILMDANAITFSLANGVARYRKVGYNDLHDAFIFELIYLQEQPCRFG